MFFKLRSSKDVSMYLYLNSIFSRASAKAECHLSNLSYVCMCVDQNKPPPSPRSGIFTRNFLISSQDLGSLPKSILELY